MMSSPLRRFWFPIPGYLGVGVTATTESEARLLAEWARAKCWPAAPAVGQVVVDVDVSMLDQKHVVPNMEAPIWAGVWYPRGLQKSHP
jgi:hypothetical protein